MYKWYLIEPIIMHTCRLGNIIIGASQILGIDLLNHITMLYALVNMTTLNITFACNNTREINHMNRLEPENSSQISQLSSLK